MDEPAARPPGGITVTDEQILAVLNEPRSEPLRLTELADRLGYSRDSLQHVKRRLLRLGWTVVAGKVQRKPGPRPRSSGPLPDATADRLAQQVQGHIDRGDAPDEALAALRRELERRVTDAQLQDALRQVLSRLDAQEHVVQELRQAMASARRDPSPAATGAPADRPDRDEARQRRPMELGTWLIGAGLVLVAVVVGALVGRPVSPAAVLPATPAVPARRFPSL